MPELVLVDDCSDTLEYYRNTLATEFKVTTFSFPEEAIEHLQANTVSLVIVDYKMPRMNGIEFYQKMRSIHTLRNVPVLILTAYSDIDIKVKSFNLGVDDFIVKPVAPQELVARVKNRLKKVESQEIEIADLRLDLISHKAFYRGIDLVLTHIEFKLLQQLLASVGSLVPREQLIEKVWVNVQVTSRVINTHMCNLRAKLENTGFMIKSPKGQGIVLKQV